MTRPLWIIILCGGVIMGISLGFRQSLGLFLTPITIDLNIGRETFALAMGLMNLVWGLASPFAGAVADRYGAGRVVLLGGLFYAAGLVAMNLSGDSNQLLLGGILLGLGLSGTGFSVILGTVGRAASPDKRSKALGITSMCGSIGQFAALPYTYLTIDSFGWVISLIILTGTTLLIVPLAIGVSGKPTPTDDSDATRSIQEICAQALRDRSFWLLNAGFFVCGFHLAFVAIHLPAYLDDKGFGPQLAAWALALVGICNILGTYGCGVLGGIFLKKNILSLLYLFRALIFLVFLAIPISEVTVLFFSAALGLLWLGTVPLTSGLIAVLFGTRYLSMLFGIVFIGHQFGGFLGAWLAGSIYDATGSYEAMWWLSVGLGLLSAFLHWPISEHPITKPAAV